MKFFRENKKGIAYRSATEGFTLIEMLVAIVVFTIAVVSMMVILGGGISDTNLAKDRLIASYLAQEQMEELRNFRDTQILYSQENWVDFLANNFKPCSEGDPCWFDFDNFTVTQCFDPNTCQPLQYNETTGEYLFDGSYPNSKFYRQFYSLDDGDKEVEIFSKIIWVHSGQKHEVIFSNILFNWMEPIILP